MPSYRFSEVPLQAKKSVPCTVCGLKIRRQRTFSQTLNPFNQLPSGQPKTVADIDRELKATAEQWQHEPETHPACTP